VRELIKKGYWAVGIDASQWAIENAPDDVKPYVFHANATLPTPLAAKDHWDMVVSFDTLEHLTEDEIDVAIPEFFRICGGGFQYHVITTTDYTLGHDETHVTMRPIEWWRKKFEDVKNSKPEYADAILHITYERCA
jgi:cyclopropane fatty-acyl-phospholipid synthase-like methyltransferase